MSYKILIIHQGNELEFLLEFEDFVSTLAVSEDKSIGSGDFLDPIGSLIKVTL